MNSVNGTDSTCKYNYARLGTYNSGFRGIRPPIPTTTVAGYYIVPSYSAPGYDALTHGQPSCGNESSGAPYFQIGRAYGNDSDKCSTKYYANLCS